MVANQVKRRIIVDGSNNEEVRVALLEHGMIVELACDTKDKKQVKGNIYVGFISRIEPSLEAAFVDYGSDRQGFVPISEIAPEYWHTQERAHNKRNLPIQELVRLGQKLLVQVIKDERRNKGVTLTTYINLPGRACALLPNTPRSKRVRVQENQKNDDLIDALNLPAGTSIILRSDSSKLEQVQRDYEQLLTLWNSINDHAERILTPTLMHEEGSPVNRMINYYLPEDSLVEVIIEGNQVYSEAMAHFSRVLPDYVNKIQSHNKTIPIFNYYDVEEQIEDLGKKKVTLPSGGHIVVDITEALIAIDVNSGKMTRSTHDIESTALRTNIEAVHEIAKQLRLRGLSGIIVIDLISMASVSNRRIVENELQKAISTDRARINANKINDFGLLELSRQRVGVALHELNNRTCEACNGTGTIKSMRAIAQSFLKQLTSALATCHCKSMDAKLTHELMAYIMNHMARDFLELQSKYKINLRYVVSEDLGGKSYVVSYYEAIMSGDVETQAEHRLISSLVEEYITRLTNEFACRDR